MVKKKDVLMRVSPRFKELTKDLSGGKSTRETTEHLTDFMINEDLDKVYKRRTKRWRF